MHENSRCPTWHENDSPDYTFLSSLTTSPAHLTTPLAHLRLQTRFLHDSSSGISPHTFKRKRKTITDQDCPSPSSTFAGPGTPPLWSPTPPIIQGDKDGAWSRHLFMATRTSRGQLIDRTMCACVDGRPVLRQASTSAWTTPSDRRDTSPTRLF